MIQLLASIKEVKQYNKDTENKQTSIQEISIYEFL